MYFSKAIVPLSLLGSVALAAPPPTHPPGSGPKINVSPPPGSGPKINAGPSARSLPRDSQDGSVVITTNCRGNVYVSSPLGENTLAGKIAPLSVPYPAVNEAATIRLSRTKDDGTVSIREVTQIDYIRTSDNKIQYDVINIEGNPFLEDGFFIGCEGGASTSADESEETNSCNADSILAVRLCFSSGGP